MITTFNFNTKDTRGNYFSKKLNKCGGILIIFLAKDIRKHHLTSFTEKCYKYIA